MHHLLEMRRVYKNEPEIFNIHIVTARDHMRDSGRQNIASYFLLPLIDHSQITGSHSISYWVACRYLVYLNNAIYTSIDEMNILLSCVNLI